MIYGISDDEAQELTDEQVQRKLCSLLEDMRLKRQWVAELSFERQEAEVVMTELQPRRGRKDQKEECP
jgi:hypothetical protein